MLKPPSTEEAKFIDWCTEAKDHGLVERWTFQPHTYELIAKQTRTVAKELKTKTKYVEKAVLRAHSYTPDFILILTSLGRDAFAEVFSESFATEGGYADITIDTKGGYTVQHGQSQMFSCNRKLMLWLKGVYVEKVIPDEFFLKTWCPESCRWMKGRKLPTLNKLGAACRTIGEFLEATE